jgi:hypothetical protein
VALGSNSSADCNTSSSLILRGDRIVSIMEFDIIDVFHTPDAQKTDPSAGSNQKCLSAIAYGMQLSGTDHVTIRRYESTEFSQHPCIDGYLLPITAAFLSSCDSGMSARI